MGQWVNGSIGELGLFRKRSGSPVSLLFATWSGDPEQYCGIISNAPAFPNPDSDRGGAAALKNYDGLRITSCGLRVFCSVPFLVPRLSFFVSRFGTHDLKFLHFLSPWFIFPDFVFLAFVRCLLFRAVSRFSYLVLELKI